MTIKFHHDHVENVPVDVCALYEKLAFEMKERQPSYGSMAIINRLRWDYDISSESGEQFRVPNEWQTILSRWLVHKYPNDGFKKFFRLKTSKYD